MEKLIGKTALVTGSTDGVGRLVARELGQAGARAEISDGMKPTVGPGPG
jgi:NAD(P)-dependent dehydrogenase (short-subunit alcohol dehydrogenase family)